ncbi:hypothetical protein ACVK1X_004655 [Pseudomonas sp. PvR086]|jgi:hypothetical protein
MHIPVGARLAREGRNTVNDFAGKSERRTALSTGFHLAEPSF